MSTSDETDPGSRASAGVRRPLREGGERAATRIDDVNRGFEPAARAQAVAWARLQDALPGGAAARRAGAARRRAWLLSFMVGAGAAVALLFLALRSPRLGPPAPGGPASLMARRDPAPSGAAGRPTPSVTAPAGPAERPRDEEIAPVSLRPGRTLIAGAVRARLSSRGVAALRAAPGSASRFELERGTLRMEVAALAPDAASGPSVAVQVASYRLMEAAPGRFSVTARRGELAVEVHAGAVTVWSSTRLLARVVAGQRWTSAPARTPGGGAAAVAIQPTRAGGEPFADGGETPSEAPRPNAPTPPDEPRDCARLTRDGATERALACFEAEAARPGLAGELALIELARIRRDVKGDFAGAERALEEYRRRFPRGSLSVEAAGSRVELLLQLGRAAEALAESERLPAGEGTFWRGVCLLRLGRRAEAGRALDEYLARGDGKRRAEALRLREKIAP
jgi:hypothetical protein